MSAQGPHKITYEFEQELCRYTGAPFALCTDNCSNAIGLCLSWYADYWKERCAIQIPAQTYVSVPCEILLAGFKVLFAPPTPSGLLKGAYQLIPTPIYDSALRFTADMWKGFASEFGVGTLVCISFSGPYKHLKLGKGGAILLDDPKMYEWLKKARNSGRSECSYHVDNFTMLGRNAYMMPEIAARGLLLMQQFYNADGSKKHNEDLCLPYPDLSRFPIFTQ